MGPRHPMPLKICRVTAIALLVSLQLGCATQHQGKTAEEVGHETRHQIEQGAKNTGETLEKGAHEAGDTLEEKGKDAGKSLKRVGHDIRDFFKGLFGIE